MSEGQLLANFTTMVPELEPKLNRLNQQVKQKLKGMHMKTISLD